VLNKFSSSKGLNIIPLKALNSARETNEKLNEKFISPRLKDFKLPLNNLSPANRSKLLPITNKNGVTTNAPVGFETNKYSNKVYENIIGNLKNKSPSPKHSELPKTNFKKSSELRK
jgi:hypothetical protein